MPAGSREPPFPGPCVRSGRQDPARPPAPPSERPALRRLPAAPGSPAPAHTHRTDRPCRWAVVHGGIAALPVEGAVQRNGPHLGKIAALEVFVQQLAHILFAAAGGQAGDGGILQRVLAGSDGVTVKLKSEIQCAEHQRYNKPQKGEPKLPGGGRPAAENGQMFHQKITPLALGFQAKNSHGGVEKQN